MTQASSAVTVEGLEARSRAARTIESLAFTIANETWQLFPYRQALVWQAAASGQPQLLAVSGLAALPEDSPFTVWVRRFTRAQWPAISQAPQSPLTFDLEEAARTVSTLDGWEAWWPRYLTIVPLAEHTEPAGQLQLLGAAFFLFESQPNPHALASLSRLQPGWSYCAWALSRHYKRRWGQVVWNKRVRWIALAAIVGLSFVPIRQSVLAPAEIVALKAAAVASPLDGVIHNFHVQPNQAVAAGQALFSLDDTTLRNRREITARALEVAAAELLAAQQRAFDDPKARSEVATLQSRIAERQAELQAVQDQLNRVQVQAPRAGVAVFGDVNDWQGKPIVTGERVLQLADPKDAGILVYLPVADAITLTEGAQLRVFLNVDPLSPMEATLTESSYQAVLSPDGIAAYRLRAQLQPQHAARARIGLKGTAKLYGEQVPLIYYLLRRPLAALRQWIGV